MRASPSSSCQPLHPSLTGTDGNQQESWWHCRKEPSKEGNFLALFSEEKIYKAGTGMMRLFQEVDKEPSKEGNFLALFLEEKIYKAGTGMMRLFQEVDKAVTHRRLGNTQWRS